MTRGVRRAVSLRLDGGRGEIVVCEPRADGQSGAGHRGGLLTLLAAPPAPGSVKPENICSSQGPLTLSVDIITSNF